MTEGGPSPFERAVAVISAGAGRYRATVDAAWSGPVAANGGLLGAIMIRAAEAELGRSGPPPRAIAAHYLDIPAPGPVEVTVEVLRQGRRVAFCDVRLRSEDRLVAQATITCSATREQALSPAPSRQAPAVPPAADVPALTLEEIPGAPAMLGRLDFRPVFGPRIFSGPGAGDGDGEVVTGGWAAIRDDAERLDAARLCALCDLWWPPLFGRLNRPAALPTLQLTVYLRDTTPRVSPPVLARFATRTVSEGHLEEHGELWSADGRLLAESNQLALLVLS